MFSGSNIVYPCSIIMFKCFKIVVAFRNAHNSCCVSLKQFEPHLDVNNPLATSPSLLCLCPPHLGLILLSLNIFCLIYFHIPIRSTHTHTQTSTHTCMYTNLACKILVLYMNFHTLLLLSSTLNSVKFPHSSF